jgi:hypothetical protein
MKMMWEEDTSRGYGRFERRARLYGLRKNVGLDKKAALSS